MSNNIEDDVVDDYEADYRSGRECSGDARFYWKSGHRGQGEWGVETYKKCLRSNDVYRHMKLDYGKDGLHALLRGTSRVSQFYRKCSVLELVVFVRDRRLLSHIPTFVSKGQLIKTLKAADRDASFDRFLDLPPELRIRVYEVYVLEFKGKVGFTAAQPPVTKASKLVRGESLPIFYRNVRFGLKFAWQDTYESYPTTESRLVHAAVTKPFWDSLGDHNLSQVRELYVLNTIAEWSSERFLIFEIDLAIDGQRVACAELVDWAAYAQNTSSDNMSPEDISLTVSKVQDLVDEISARPGPRKLQRGDIDRLRRACDFRERDLPAAGEEAVVSSGVSNPQAETQH